MKENKHQGDKLTQLNHKHIGLFYIHLNVTESWRGDHALLKLC